MNLEDYISEALAEGLSRSPMLASSVAAKLVDSPKALELILNKLPSETISKAIASEILRRTQVGGVVAEHYRVIMRAAGIKAAEIIAEDMARSVENA